MRQFFILVALFISFNAFSQIVTDSVIAPTDFEGVTDSVAQSTEIKSVVMQKIDTVQIERIDNIERNLSAFYTYNRRSQNLLFLSAGLSVAGILLAYGDNITTSNLVTLTGGVVSIIGTVVYLNSYKFLKFDSIHVQ